MTKTADEIVEVFGLPEAPRTNPIPRDKVVSWMQADDIEALGALYTFILDKTNASRIQPPLSFDDYREFILHYYDRCFQENPDGEWTDSSYSAGAGLVNWFKGLWKDEAVPRTALAEIKKWLAELYKHGDTRLRTCIVNATLEHLFEDKKIANYFSDWKKDSVLSEAYSEAMLWTKRFPNQKP